MPSLKFNIHVVTNCLD